MSRGKRKYDPLVKGVNSVEGDWSGIAGLHNAGVEDARTHQLVADGEGMIELLRVCGIAEGEDQWLDLALALARKYESGFQMEAGPRGRPKTWGNPKLRQLYDDVQDKLKASGKDNESEACMHLKQKYGLNHGNLYRRYKEAKLIFSAPK